VCQNGPKKSATFQPESKYQRSNSLCTHHILPHVTSSFPRIEKFAHRSPFFNQLKTSIRKWQSYLKHFQKMTSGNAWKTRMWRCVTSDGKGIICRINRVVSNILNRFRYLVATQSEKETVSESNKGCEYILRRTRIHIYQTHSLLSYIHTHIWPSCPFIANSNPLSSQRYSP